MDSPDGCNFLLFSLVSREVYIHSRGARFMIGYVPCPQRITSIHDLHNDIRSVDDLIELLRTGGKRTEKNRRRKGREGMRRASSLMKKRQPKSTFYRCDREEKQRESEGAVRTRPPVYTEETHWRRSISTEISDRLSALHSSRPQGMPCYSSPFPC